MTLKRDYSKTNEKLPERKKRICKINEFRSWKINSLPLPVSQSVSQSRANVCMCVYMFSTLYSVHYMMASSNPKQKLIHTNSWKPLEWFGLRYFVVTSFATRSSIGNRVTNDYCMCCNWSALESFSNCYERRDSFSHLATKQRWASAGLFLSQYTG